MATHGLGRSRCKTDVSFSNAQENAKQDKAIGRGVSKGEWLQAALESLANGSVSDISVEDLARSRGISKSGFYWHFRSRDDLLDQVLEHWNHEITEIITKNVEVQALGPKARLRRTAEMIVDNDLVRFELGIRQWAMKDKRAARVVRSVNRRRLDFTRQALGEIGFSGDDLDMRAMLFVCYQTWEAPMFREISRKRRRELIGKRIALLTKK